MINQFPLSFTPSTTLYTASTCSFLILIYSHIRVHRFNRYSSGAGIFFFYPPPQKENWGRLWGSLISEVQLSELHTPKMHILPSSQNNNICKAGWCMTHHSDGGRCSVYWLTRIYVITICLISSYLWGKIKTAWLNYMSLRTSIFDFDAAEAYAQQPCCLLNYLYWWNFSKKIYRYIVNHQ